MTAARAYYDIELKTQSKRLKAALELGLSEFDLQIHGRYEDKYFSGQQAWRNPVVLRVSLPVSDRLPFIQKTKLWLHKPEKVGVPIVFRSPKLPLRGNHNTARLRRNYHYSNRHDCWITNFDPTDTRSIGERDREYLNGRETLIAVLNGDLDRVLYR